MGLKKWLSLDFSKHHDDARGPPSPSPSRKSTASARPYPQQQQPSLQRQSSVRSSYRQPPRPPQQQQQFGIERYSEPHRTPLPRRASALPGAFGSHLPRAHDQHHFHNGADRPYQSESGYYFEENGVDDADARSSVYDPRASISTRGGHERASVYRDARDDYLSANQVNEDRRDMPRMSFTNGNAKNRRVSYATQQEAVEESLKSPQPRRSSIFRFPWLGGKNDNDTRLSQLAIDDPRASEKAAAPPRQEEAEIVMQGWLEKCGQQVNTWNMRFFVLRADGMLSYYADSQLRKYKGSLNVGYGSKANISMQSNTIDKKFVFMISTDRNLLISAPSQKEMTKWIAKLHAAGAAPSEPWDPSKKTVNFFVRHAECPHEWKRYDDPTSYIHMEGCLMKRGHINKNWKNRFFRIERGELRYYSENQDELKGSVPLKGTIVSPGMTQSPDGHKNYFVLTSKDGKFEMHLTAPNEQAMHRWIEALQEAQSALGGRGAKDTVSGLALVVKQAEEIPLAKEEVVYEAPELINVELERRMEALIVGACRAGTVPVGSQLIAVENRSVLRESYTAARHVLRSATCPLRLHFLVPPYKKGELIKKSRSGFENWKRRLVILTNGELQYYKQVGSSATNEKKTLKHRKTFPLYGCYLNLIQMPGREFCIIIARSPTDKLVLEARNEQERIEWASAIYCTIRMVSQGVTPGHIDNLHLEVARDPTTVAASDLDGSFKQDLPFASD